VNTAFKESFARDLKTVRNKKLLKRVKEVIEAVEQAETLTALPQLKKLKGEQSYFRLRVGEYRMALRSKKTPSCLFVFSHEKTSIDIFHEQETS
jgi:mRNA interferase RelE/StbE